MGTQDDDKNNMHCHDDNPSFDFGQRTMNRFRMWWPGFSGDPEPNMLGGGWACSGGGAC